MVYVYRKIKSGKSYYYLRISKRKGDKVITKDIAYLGTDVAAAKKAVMKLPKYKTEIRKSYRKINLFFETEHYSNVVKDMKLKKDLYLGDNQIDIEACRLHYVDHYEKFEIKTKKDFIEEFATHFVYNTTSLEGNTITLEETHKLLSEGKTPKDTVLKEIYDIQNTEEVFNKMLGFRRELSHPLIIEIHKGLVKNIDKRIGYRITDNRVFKSHFDSTPGVYVKTDMDLLLKWYSENKDKLHPLVLATLFHHKFEKVHPFSDGNGRTGRMIANYILIRNGYPPMIVYRKNRTEYLDALSSADKVDLMSVDIKRYNKLVSFMADQMLTSYWNIFL